jgi:hypothetical protein
MGWIANNAAAMNAARRSISRFKTPKTARTVPRCRARLKR